MEIRQKVKSLIISEMKKILLFCLIPSISLLYLISIGGESNNNHNSSDQNTISQCNYNFFEQCS